MHRTALLSLIALSLVACDGEPEVPIDAPDIDAPDIELDADTDAPDVDAPDIDASVDAGIDGGTVVPFGPLSTVTSNHSIRADGTLWAWGINSFGRLGTGDVMDQPTPVQIGSDTDWISVVGGTFFRIALKRDGRVYAWGLDQNGELAGAGTGMVTAPTLVPGLTDVISIGAGDFHGLAVKRDRTLWAWGSNDTGQCGQAAGGPAVRTPMQVPGVTDVLAATGGNSHTLVIARDTQVNAKVWSFGSNYSRELGVSSPATATPQLIAVLGNATAIAGGYRVSAAIAGGTLYTWGTNDNFQIGSANNPQTVPFNTGVAARSAVVSAYETLATRPDGQLHGVGANLFGPLNGMSGTARLTFVQVTSVSDARVVSGPGAGSILILGNDRSLSWIGGSPVSPGINETTPQALLTNVRFPDDPI